MTFKEQKMWLFIEMVIGSIVTASLLGLTLIMAYSNVDLWIKILVIAIAFIHFIIGAFVCLKIEQVIGKYECQECGHRYVPTYKAVNLAPHLGRTRYMRCPKCGKKSWNKKTLDKK